MIAAETLVWSEVQSAVTGMRNAFKAFVHIGFADANARIGYVGSLVVAVCVCASAKPGDLQGLRLREYAERNKVFLVNTFFNPGTTWTSAYGTVVRIDYVYVDVAGSDAR